MRFDHVLWVTPNLDDSARAFTDQGFHVSERGEHPRQGTRNHCIHFGLAYIELIGVWNTTMLQETGSPLLAGLHRAQSQGETLYTFALAVRNLDRVAEALRSAGIPVGQPAPGSRLRPDGTTVRWRILPLPEQEWGSMPFLIEWNSHDAERLAELRAVGFVADHPVGKLAMDHLAIAVPNLGRSADQLGRLLRVISTAEGQDCPEPRRGHDPDLGVDYVEFPLQEAALRLVSVVPSGAAALQGRVPGSGLLYVAVRPIGTAGIGRQTAGFRREPGAWIRVLSTTPEGDNDHLVANPADDPFRAIRQSLFHRFLGVELIEVGERMVRLRVPFRDDFLGDPWGQTIHGGILSTVLDIAACFAVIVTTGNDAPTVNLRVDYLRPGRAGEDLFAVGRCLRAGRTLGVADAEVTTEEGKILAVGRGTFATAAAIRGQGSGGAERH